MSNDSARLTPTLLAAILGHSPKEVRDWLRNNRERPESKKRTRWVVTEEMAIAYGQWSRR